MSETLPTRLLRELEEDVSSARDRAQVFRRLAEAFEAAGDASRAEGALTEARAFDLYGNDNGEAFPGYFQPPVVVAGGPTDPPQGFYTPQRLEHLAERARAASNPIHAARFADVAWDFGMRRFEVAKLAVEKCLECLELYKMNRGDREFEEAAKRAARLAHMLRNEESSSKVKERLLEYARGVRRLAGIRAVRGHSGGTSGSTSPGIDGGRGKRGARDPRTGGIVLPRGATSPGAAFGDVEGPNEFMVRLAHQVRIELGGSLVDRPSKRLEINRSLERQADARRNNSPLAALSLFEGGESGFRHLPPPKELERIR